MPPSTVAVGWDVPPPRRRRAMRARLAMAALAAALLGVPDGPAAAAAMEKVTYGVVSWNPLHWVVMMGAAKGVFERHGVALDLVVTGNASAAVQAMIGGSIHLTTTTPAAAFLAQDKAPEMKQILGVFERCPYTLVVNPEIKRIEDLRGKVLGATGVKTSSDVETLRIMLSSHGFQDGRDYTVVAVGAVQQRTQALLNKTIWGVAQMEPYTTFLRDHGMRELARAADYPNLRLLEMVSVVGMRPWYAAHEETLARFLGGWAEATEWLYDPQNKAEAVQVLADRMKVEGRYAANAYRVFVEELKGFPPRGRLHLDAVRQAAENLRILGGAPPADPARYVDLGPWEKAFRR